MKNPMNSKKTKLALLGMAALTVSTMTSTAFAEGTAGPRPMIEVGAGYEYQVMQNYSNCNGPCGGAGHSSESGRSNGVLAIGIQGLRMSDLMQGGNGAYDVRFIPLYVVLDNQTVSDTFGHVQGIGDGSSSMGPIRKLVGAVVEGSFAPGDSLLNLRAKLVQVDYDRDKGFWDWRALDASVGIRGRIRSDNGSIVFNVELNVGGGFGGVHLNGYKDIENALNVAPKMEGNAFTFDPYAALHAGLRIGSFKMEWITQGERRMDLTPGANRGTYMGTSLNVNSTHVVSALDAEFILGKHGFDSTGPRIGFFANGAYDFDNLTLSNMFFRQNDSFQSFRLIAGLRGRF